MKKIVVTLTAIIVCTFFHTVSADDIIKGPMPEKFPEPEKCAGCHKIKDTNIEIQASPHKDMKCLDCHIPGAVQRKKYESKDIAFEKLGYHQQEGKWIETKGNAVCLRCHAENGIQDTKETCWSCHMPKDGMDELYIVKDKKKPVSGDNIREIKTIPHKSHRFIIHGMTKSKKG